MKKLLSLIVLTALLASCGAEISQDEESDDTPEIINEVENIPQDEDNKQNDDEDNKDDTEDNKEEDEQETNETNIQEPLNEEEKSDISMKIPSTITDEETKKMFLDMEEEIEKILQESLEEL